MYYSIQYQTEGNFIGKEYPQTECLTLIHAHSLNAWEFPDFEPKLIFNLSKKAILTDILSNAAINANGLLVNLKVKELLKGFNLLNHKFYEVIINYKNTFQTYYWLHICEPTIIDTIDYTKSLFYRTEYTFREELINLTSFEEYKILKSKDKDGSFGVELDQIYVTEKFNKNLDLLTFLPFDNNIYISEALKSALEENNITGINYEVATNLNI